MNTASPMMVWAAMRHANREDLKRLKEILEDSEPVTVRFPAEGLPFLNDASRVHRCP